MNEQKNTNTPKPSRPLLFYYFMVLLVLLILNALLVPQLRNSGIVESDYGSFLQAVDEGVVTEVEQKDGEIYYVIPMEDGSEVIYSTGVWENDTDLVQRLYGQNIAFTNVIPQENSPLVTFLFGWVLPIFFLVAIGQIVGQMLRKRTNQNTMSFGKSDAKIHVKAETGITFKDVAGQNEAKESLREVVDLLDHPKKYEEIGARCPKGVLLVGPPGTGKTLLAKAVAGEANVPFFSISGSEFVEMFVGLGAAKVRDLFKQASEKAPCIIFIDEIDTIGKKRDSGGFGSNDEREQTLNQLLAEMDGFDSSKGVILLAATNRPESLDPALLRPGRFDRRVPVDLPDLNGRIAILSVHSKEVRLAPDVDFEPIARATAGASGADLSNMINEAALRAVRCGHTAVRQSDLEESVEVVLAGYQRKNAVISSKEKQLVAYHEIGHAVVAAKQSGTAPVHKITIVPRTSGALGYTMQVEEEEKNLMSREDILNRIAILCGGRSAEEEIFGIMTSGASNDIEQATKLARAMVSQYGMTDTFDMVALETVKNVYLGGESALACGPDTVAQVDAMVISIIKEAHEKARLIIRENRVKIEELTRYLLEKETITGEEFMKILNQPTEERIDNESNS